MTWIDFWKLVPYVIKFGSGIIEQFHKYNERGEDAKFWEALKTGDAEWINVDSFRRRLFMRKKKS